MTLLEEKFMSVVPNHLKDIAIENADIANELHTMNGFLMELIDLLKEKDVLAQ